jgi:hypothetical protein
MLIIHKRTWLIRKVRMQDGSVCCVAVRGTTSLDTAARRIVMWVGLTSVTPMSVSAPASTWSDHFVLTNRSSNLTLNRRETESQNRLVSRSALT